MADDVWILGINMTKFGKHPDKDTVDLGAEPGVARRSREVSHENLIPIADHPFREQRPCRSDPQGAHHHEGDDERSECGDGNDTA